MTNKYSFDFQLENMFVRFHLEQGRLLWERLRFIWKISRKPVKNSSLIDRGQFYFAREGIHQVGGEKENKSTFCFFLFLFHFAKNYGRRSCKSKK